LFSLRGFYTRPAGTEINLPARPLNVSVSEANRIRHIRWLRIGFACWLGNDGCGRLGGLRSRATGDGAAEN